jgi:hypothetical protein
MSRQFDWQFSNVGYQSEIENRKFLAVSRCGLYNIYKQVSLGKPRLSLENQSIAFMAVLGEGAAPQFLGQMTDPAVNFV